MFTMEVCQECGKCFALENTFKNTQVIVHKGMKPSKGQACGKGFSRKTEQIMIEAKLSSVMNVGNVLH